MREFIIRWLGIKPCNHTCSNSTTTVVERQVVDPEFRADLDVLRAELEMLKEMPLPPRPNEDQYKSHISKLSSDLTILKDGLIAASEHRAKLASDNEQLIAQLASVSAKEQELRIGLKRALELNLTVARGDSPADLLSVHDRVGRILGEIV